MKIDWQIIPDYIQFKRYQKAMRVLQQTQKYDVKTAIVITAIKIGGAFVFLGVAGLSFGSVLMPTTDEVKNKPLNAPSYDSAPHRIAASELCEVETGKPGLVQASKKVWATNVVVVRQDGIMQRMDTTEAWDRSKSKNRADDIWVVGVCKSDIVKQEAKA